MLTTLMISQSLLERKIRSFFRQLNSYGFVKSSETSWRNKYSFSHPLFQRDLPHLLGKMQRRKPSFHRKTAKDKRRTVAESSNDILIVASSTTPDVQSSTVFNANQTSLSSMSGHPNSSRFTVSNPPENNVSSSTITIPCITHPDQLSTGCMNEDGPTKDAGLTIDLDRAIAFLKETLCMHSP